MCRLVRSGLPGTASGAGSDVPPADCAAMSSYIRLVDCVLPFATRLVIWCAVAPSVAQYSPATSTRSLPLLGRLAVVTSSAHSTPPSPHLRFKALAIALRRASGGWCCTPPRLTRGCAYCSNLPAINGFRPISGEVSISRVSASVKFPSFTSWSPLLGCAALLPRAP